MNFRPLHDRVVVRRIEEDERSTGGIIIPDTAKEKPSQGEVVAVGPGARDETGKVTPLDVKAGDQIIFGKWSGTEVKIPSDTNHVQRIPPVVPEERLPRYPLMCPEPSSVGRLPDQPYDIEEPSCRQAIQRVIETYMPDRPASVIR